MNTTAYLEHIHYNPQTAKTDKEALFRLHAAHIRHVPFENLDIGMKREIKLDERSLWNKIVIRNRGGFCYELNGLFAWLLKHLGFNVTYLNARVFDREGNLGIQFDHLTLLVQIPGQPERWLADVGFGDSFSEPLSLEIRGDQAQGLRSYKIERGKDGFITWQKNYDGEWDRQYFFELQPRFFPNDFEISSNVPGIVVHVRKHHQPRDPRWANLFRGWAAHYYGEWPASRANHPDQEGISPTPEGVL